MPRCHGRKLALFCHHRGLNVARWSDGRPHPGMLASACFAIGGQLSVRGERRIVAVKGPQASCVMGTPARPRIAGSVLLAPCGLEILSSRRKLSRPLVFGFRRIKLKRLRGVDATEKASKRRLTVRRLRRKWPMIGRLAKPPVSRKLLLIPVAPLRSPKLFLYENVSRRTVRSRRPWLYHGVSPVADQRIHPD